jgi:hypothetical protein
MQIAYITEYSILYILLKQIQNKFPRSHTYAKTKQSICIFPYEEKYTTWPKNINLFSYEIINKRQLEIGFSKNHIWNYCKGSSW